MKIYAVAHENIIIPEEYSKVEIEMPFKLNNGFLCSAILRK